MNKKKVFFFYILRRAAPKYGCKFGLDKQVMLHSCWDICNSRCVFNSFDLKIFQSKFLLLISNEFGLMLSMPYSSPYSKFQSPIMSSDTETQEMLIILHIRFFCCMVVATWILVTSRLSYCVISAREVLWLIFR